MNKCKKHKHICSFFVVCMHNFILSKKHPDKMGLSGHQNCVFKIFEGEELQDFMLSQYYSHHPKQLLTFYNPFKLLYVTSPEILIPPLNFLL